MKTTIIENATIVTCDPARTVLHNSAIAIKGSRIATLGPTPQIRSVYPNAQVIDGRGKAVFPGLINCHSHLTANLFRGISEDFGFPSSFAFPEDVRDMVSDEETTVMAALGAIEAARTGSTTTVEISGGIHRYADLLDKTGMRWVLAENTADGVVSPTFRSGEPVHAYSDRLREESLEQATHLFEKWHHGAETDRITCMGSTGLVETSSPSLLRSVHELAEKYDSRYTIHLNQSRLEVESLMLMRGVRPTQSLYHNDYLGLAFSPPTSASCIPPRFHFWAPRAPTSPTSPPWPPAVPSFRPFPLSDTPVVPSAWEPTTTPRTWSR